MRNTLRLLVPGLLLLAVAAAAKNPMVITNLTTGSVSSNKSQGLLQFVDGWSSNPFNAQAALYGHPFQFNLTGSGSAITAVNFKSSELGINRTFSGANTAQTLAALKSYLRSKDFEKSFYKLFAPGQVGGVQGSPYASAGSTARRQLKDAMFQRSPTRLERRSQTQSTDAADPGLFAGFGEIQDHGYSGSVISVSPGFTLDFGEQKDRHLNVTLPVTRISIGGLTTYRVGGILQYQFPVDFGDKTTLTVGPGLSYFGTKTLDLPDFSGLIGGALSLSLNHDFNTTYFGTAGLYFGRFQDLGGVDTGTRANIVSCGLQGGRHFGQRTLGSLYLISIGEFSASYRPAVYHTVGAALTYKLFDKFDLTFSVNSVLGLPQHSQVGGEMGSAWFF